MNPKQTFRNALVLIGQIEQGEGNTACVIKDLVNLLRQSEHNKVLPPLLVAIESELDTYPAEHSRHLYNPTYLRALDEAVSCYIRDNRQSILQACEQLKQSLRSL